MYATAVVAKHNKANCKLAAERCRAIAVIIQNCAHEYANANDGTKYVSNLNQLLNHVKEMKAMVEKYSTFSKLKQFVHSSSFHDVYNRINVKISQVLQLISADLGTLAVHQNTEILNAMRFNEMLESMDLLQRKTDDNEVNRSQMEGLLREKLHETATHLEKQDMKFQALKLLMEKNDSLATEKAETRARKLQKEMIRLMDQVTAAGLRQQTQIWYSKANGGSKCSAATKQ